MQFSEVGDVLEHGADHLVHHLIGHVGAGHEGRFDAEGGHVRRRGLVGPLRDGRESIKGELANQPFLRRAVQVDDARAAPIGRHRDAGIGHAHRVAVGIDLAVAQRLGLLGRGQLGGLGEILRRGAACAHQHLHGAALAGAGVADVDPLALQAAPRRRAPEAVFAALLAALRGFLVNQPANGVAGGEINAGRPAGTDADERLLRMRAVRERERRSDNRCQTYRKYG